MLTHNDGLHEVNLGWHPRAEELLWRPDLQQPKLSQNGQVERPVPQRRQAGRGGAAAAAGRRPRPVAAHPVRLLMQLSLLDRSRTRVGEPDAAALTGTVARAVAAEQLGYDGSGSPSTTVSPASPAPPRGAARRASAGRTTTIRLGSAGVMLPHHQPLVVAEQFATVSAFAPGRVDLGLGRSPGFTPPVRRALRETEPRLRRRPRRAARLPDRDGGDHRAPAARRRRPAVRAGHRPGPAGRRASWACR